MDGATEYHAKQNKAVIERQISYNCIHTWNLRKKTKWTKKKKKTNQEKDSFFNVYSFLREKEIEHEQGKGRERGTHRIQSGICTDSRELQVGLELTNHKIITWAEVDQLTNWATQVPQETDS